jgi:N-acetylglutamate synthase-like GNAT family acetyltransferase
MVPTNFRIRRATLDDLGQLTALWRSMTFAPDELARRITEFQVAVTENGVVAGALGLQIQERQGLLHHEAFTDFALADHLRPMLWDRMRAIATNQGLLQFWTREQAPFWSHNGMVRPNEEALAHLPAGWRDASGPWLTIKLRDDPDAILKADQQLLLFMQMERQKTARTLRRAKALKALALFLASALVLFALGAAFYVFWKHQHPPQ